MITHGPNGRHLALGGCPGARYRREIAVALASIVLGLVRTASADDRAGRELFETRIRPVLAERCYKCHSGGTRRPKGGLRLDTPEGVERGGEGGPIVVPGKPGESRLIDAIAYTDTNLQMPPKEKLSDAVIADFRRWVAMGAPDPRSRDTAHVAKRSSDALDWWSLRPLARPGLPAVDPEGERWSRTPVDRFVYATLNANGLRPAPEADRRTLIRRLSFDLVGLPPTPEQIAAFEADPGHDAYERLVDRLLASPHFGERWARYWMDAVHFAETHGHDQDRIRPNAWRYRDYLIESFNRDTPYGRFVEEQLAADVLFPEEPRLTVALGFIAAGPWDESSLRDIREDSIDRQVGFYLDRDDMVTTTMATFVSSTVHCARCHDHKFDPISQADYYSLQADFAGVDRADRAFDTDSAVARSRRELLARKKALEKRDPAFLATLLEPAVQAEVAAWESERRSAPPAPWTVLDPDALASTAGVTLTEQPDHSIVSSGAKPAQDTYTITVRTDLRGITAVRLEVLPDDGLPAHGPGRAGNGNLHLTEFQVSAAPKSAPDKLRPIAIRAASADFEQTGWNIAAAVDGNDQTAWGIYPAVGKPHQAVFELAEDVGDATGTTLRFALRQTNPANHLIGRLRLAVTTAARPVRVPTLPDAIATIVAVPAERRSAEQKQTLAAHVVAGSLERQLNALPAPLLVYAGASDYAPDGSHKPAGGPRPVHLLRRGDIHQKGPLAEPGTLACAGGLPARFKLSSTAGEGARRAALARWITHPQNPLTWRSIVNRQWQYHFGRGLVDTPNDFGRMGAVPSHPALLDWLALEFRDSGGSLKRLHRLLVMSAVYRQQTRHDANAAERDADNRLLWRQNRRRLDAESVRDAVLVACGRLDPAMGGPSVQQFELRPGVHVTPVLDYDKFDWSAPGSGRRSVYRFLFRTLPDPFMDSLDEADASQLTPERNESLTPLQALALLNDRFVLRHAGLLAQRVEAGERDRDAQIRSAFLRTLGRPPAADELHDWRRYADRWGLANVCRMLFNSSEFLFVD
jgi:hypothetical protein